MNQLYSLPPMLSYTQEAEDAVLRRVFPDLTNGFYVDVGAAWPDKSSVTKYFYDKGWSGINIEPQPELFGLLERHRPRDINLQVAIGTGTEHVSLRIYPDRKGRSTINEALKATYSKLGIKGHDVKVSQTSLDKVLEQHAKRKTIHFLKIDVEGCEQAVVESVDLSRWRPEVVIVEVNALGTTAQEYSWESLLTQAGYAFALFDGVNRFYARSPKIVEKLSVPANAYDRYIPDYWWSRLSREVQLELKEEHCLGEDFPIKPKASAGTLAKVM